MNAKNFFNLMEKQIKSRNKHFLDKKTSKANKLYEKVCKPIKNWDQKKPQ